MFVLAIFGLIITFYLLAIICDGYFVESLDIISGKLRLNSEVAGATLMAMGSSAPELFTSLIAVFSPGGLADIGAGTIVGSAIFNLLVIIGASAMVASTKLTWQPILRDLLFYCIAIIAMIRMFWDGQIILHEALILLTLYAVYIFAVLNWSKWFGYYVDDSIEVLEENIQPKQGLNKYILNLLDPIMYLGKQSKHSAYITFTFSIIFIGLLSYIMVESAVIVSHTFHIHPAIIALTVLAAGTSVPDLLSSLIVARQGRGDMAVSNAVGSNVFDILFGLGLPWTLVLLFTSTDSITVSSENLLSSAFLLFATVVALFALLIMRRWHIGRPAGLMLIILYIGYVLYQIGQILQL